LSPALPGLSPALPGAPRFVVGAPRLVAGAPSYSEGRQECPPSVWYSPEIDASKFTLHILSDTPGGFQWLKYILLMQTELCKAVGKATGWKAGRCRHVQISELFSIEECDQAVMDFLAATEVGKFPPKWSSGRERAQGLGLRSGIGSNGLYLPFFPFLSFVLSFFLSFSYLSFVSGDGG